jgi:uncharacterized membrane protein
MKRIKAKRRAAMNTLKTISFIFIPLGFLGGLVQGNFAIAVLSPIFWFIIFIWASGKNK